MLRRIRSLIVLPLVLAACDTPTGTGTPVPGEPSVQRQRWDRQGIDDYRFDFSRTCFCEELPLVRVVVRNDQVVEVREAQTGRLLPRDRWDQIPTVDRVFDYIEQTEARNQPVEVEFHSRLGYPVRATLGTLANDAGAIYFLDRLEPTD